MVPRDDQGLCPDDRIERPCLCRHPALPGPLLASSSSLRTAGGDAGAIPRVVMPDASHLQRRGPGALSFQNQHRPAGAIDLDALPIPQALRCPAGADHRWYAVLPRDHRRMAQNATAVGDQTTHGSEQ